MANEYNQGIINSLPYAYAYHEIVRDDSGETVDYIFIDVNPAFEMMTGLVKYKIINRRISEIIPGFKESGKEFIEKYSQVALSGESISFKQYSEPLNRWYDITAFSDREGFFCTIFKEVTEEVSEKAALSIIADVSELLLDVHSDASVYDKIAEAARSISGAKYLGFNLFNDQETSFTTVALAGVGDNLNRVSQILGFNPVGKVWQYDQIREAHITKNEITEFSHLRKLSSNIIAPKLIESLVKIFNIGKVYVVKIMNDNIMLGDFTIMMPSGVVLQNAEYVKVLSSLIGQFIEHNKTQNRLKEKTEELERFFDVNLDLLCIADTDGNFIRVNKAWEDVLGYSREELEQKKFLDFVHPDDLKSTLETLNILENQELVLNFVNRYRAHNGTYKYIEWRSHPSGKMIYAAARDITEKKKVLDELQSSHKRFNELAKLSRTITWSVDASGLYTFVSPVAKDVFGYKPEELIGKMYFYDLFIEEERDEIKNQFMEIFTNKEPFINFINATKAKDGTRIIVTTNGLPIMNDDGTLSGYNGADTDITERIKLEEDRYFEQEKFKATLLSVGDGIIATDKQGNITVMNKVAEYLTEWTQTEAYGKPLMEVLNIIHEYTKEPCENPAEQALLTGQIIELENHTALVTRSGRQIPIEDSAAPIKNKNGLVTGVVIVFRDYTEKRDKQREVEYLSFHDHLTGLYNRRYLEDALNRLDTARNLPFSIIMADVNGLKLTNDAYGHDMGDKLLKTVADILESACRSDDIVARTGGDEFAVLLPGTNSSQVESIKRRIQVLIQNSKLDSVLISLAVGYATKTDEDQDIKGVMKEADNRMYKNKLKYGKLMRNQTIETVLRSINSKYDNEQIHTERVSTFSVAIAKAMDFAENEIDEIKKMSVLHDIGKITVAPAILNKSDKLTNDEWNIIRQHVVTGYNILKSVEEYAHLAEVVLHHHERWDGKGYPSGLKGKHIPLYSRLISVADAYEAMTSQRPYQTMKSKEEAIEELRRCSGSQFDSEIVEVFIIKVLGEQ